MFYLSVRKQVAQLRIASMVGARPNFMKIAPIVDEINRIPGIEHRLIHSGQHYDEQMSESIFRDLKMPKPDYNLGVGSGSHARQTAEVMNRFEAVMLEWKPDVTIVVGDVNSTLAAALVAAKLDIPVAHVEAGLRSFDMSMPEEINRKLTDAISNLLFVTERSGIENLQKEGILADRIFFTGNVMIDCLLKHRELAAKSDVLRRLHVQGNGASRPDYAVLTLHRPSNVDDPEVLSELLSTVALLAERLPVFFPVHPRSMERIREFGLSKHLTENPSGTQQRGIIPLSPLSYLDFLCLMDHARLLLTDSGGIQEETTILGVPCLTLRDNTERPVTVEHGTNQVVGRDSEKILAAAWSVLDLATSPLRAPELWDGRASQRILRILLEKFRPNLLTPAGQLPSG
jgi:UDP-N-acetylglucosamine 2-epimerase (non-hydrolysing)